LAEILPQALAWLDGRKRALISQITDSQGGAGLDALRGVARSALDTVDTVGGALAGAATGGAVGPQGIADRVLGPSHSTVEDAASLLGPPLKTGSMLAGKLAPWLATFGGVRALKAPLQEMHAAQNMTAAGGNAEKVWDKTGAWVAPDKKSRFEIDDSQSRLHLPEGVDQHLGKVGNFLEHDKLYEQYPHLKDIDVNIQKHPVTSGSFDPGQPPGPNGFPGFPKAINIQGPNTEDMRSTLMHELQHAIQQHEGFTTGSSPDAMKMVAEVLPNEFANTLASMARAAKAQGNDAAHLDLAKAAAQVLVGDRASPSTMEKLAHKLYEWKGGEIEARNVEERLKMSGTDRRFL
jgi:hypothetical protein